MKRLHVHVSVEDLDQSIGFYNTLFGEAPSVVKPDYAKWMLDDPRVNFAISTGKAKYGVDHLGFQVEEDGELKEIANRLEAADRKVVEQQGAVCCYARSDKAWVADPQGIPWETFLSHGEAAVYGLDGVDRTQLDAGGGGACCAGGMPDGIAEPAASESSCCAPTPARNAG
jgi:catechol 2,3-dioxygenase-like lactoylglutathione lyase family enzyme